MKVLVHHFWVNVIYCISEHIVSRLFKFRIVQETLTKTELLFKTTIITFVDNIVGNKICSCDLKAMLAVFVLSWSIKARELFITKLGFKSNIWLWILVLFSNVINQIILGNSGHIGTLGTIQGFNWASLLEPYCIVSFCLCITIITCNFFFSG